MNKIPQSKGHSSVWYTCIQKNIGYLPLLVSNEIMAMGVLHKIKRATGSVFANT